MEKYIYNYAEKVRKDTSPAAIGIDIKPSKGQILDLLLIFSDCSEPAREIEVWVAYNKSGSNTTIQYVGDIADNAFEIGKFVWPFQYNHVELFQYPKMNKIILTEEDELTLRYNAVAVNETVLFSIRAMSNIYAKPTIAYSINSTVINEYEDNISGVIE